MPPDGERPQSDLTLRAEYYSAFKKWEILARVRNLADGVLVKSARLRRAEAASYTGVGEGGALRNKAGESAPLGTEHGLSEVQPVPSRCPDEKGRWGRSGERAPAWWEFL